jgi:hypothetical protein
MSERFIVFNGTDEIGRSDLEHGDPYQGIRTGRFAPEPGYTALEPLYQELTLVSFEETQAANKPEKQRALQARHEQLRDEAAAVALRVQTSSGQTVPTRWVHIEDFSTELGDSERYVTLCVDDYSTYELFFS